MKTCDYEKNKPIKIRIISVIMLVTMLVISSLFKGVKFVEPEEYDAAVSVTADEAINWVRSKEGQIVEADGSATGSATYAQCVDLIKAYCDYLGVPRINGNAITYTYADKEIPEGWVRIQGATPQKGDILLYTGGVGGYGHVGIFESTYSTYHQNVDGYYGVMHDTYKYDTFSTPYWGVIRPNFSTTVVPSSVTLNKTSATLTTKGATTTLTATVSPSNATDKSVTWKSSNTSVAKVSSTGVVTAVANGTATITATTNSGGKTATCKVTVSIPTLKDGWYYTSVLPSDVTTSKYEIQYQNVYKKYATTSPGTGWSDTGVDKKEYTKSGSTYGYGWPIATSETVRLDHYYYFHCCRSSDGVANYDDGGGAYPHIDKIEDVSKVYEAESHADGQYTYYRLKWNDGSDAYCCSAGYASSGKDTCDGSYGEHGNRTYYWYKMYVYQNYTVKTLNQYQKTSDWGTSKDASATAVNYRYRLKPTGVSLNKTNVTLTSKGSTVQLSARVSPSDAENKNVTWWSTEPSVATVSSSGLVTAVGNGTTIIAVETVSGGQMATCKITVSIAPTGVSLNKTSDTLTTKGETTQLTAMVSPSNAANKNVTWKSSDTSVATVSSTGLVTAVGNGTATITATTNSGGKIATCKITVSIAVTGITLDKTDVTLKGSGSSIQLTATVLPSDAVNKTVTWKTSDSTVVTVSNGKLIAVAPGTATITARCGGKTATCKVTVTQPLTGITLNETSLMMNVGTTEKLEVSYNPSNTTDSKALIWASSDSSVVKVVDGKVTAVAPGKATITATCNGKKAVCTITVKQPLTGISISSTKLDLNVSETATLTVIYNESNTTDNKVVTWKSNNTSVVTVEGGKVVAVGPGKATITATCGINTATCEVVVQQPLTSIQLNETNMALQINGTKQLKVIFNPSNTTDSKSIVWSSSDESVAVVKDGKITAKGAGKAVITAMCGVHKASRTVTVNQPLDNISLNTTNLVLDTGMKETLKLVYNAGGLVENMTVTWKSSNPSVVQVSSSGEVTAVGSGMATIIALTEDGVQVAACDVTVMLEEKEPESTENREEDTEPSTDTEFVEPDETQDETDSVINTEKDTELETNSEEDTDSEKASSADDSNSKVVLIAVVIATICVIAMGTMIVVVICVLRKRR